MRCKVVTNPLSLGIGAPKCRHVLHAVVRLKRGHICREVTISVSHRDSTTVLGIAKCFGEMFQRQIAVLQRPLFTITLKRALELTGTSTDELFDPAVRLASIIKRLNGVGLFHLPSPVYRDERC